MPNLKWNEHDFVEALGVLPKFDEEWVEYTFQLKIENLFLKIVIIDYESFVNISLAQELSEQVFLDFSFLVRGEVSYVNEKKVAFLRFSDCIVSNYYDPDFFDKNKYPTYSNFEIHTFPRFKLKFL